MCDYSRRLRSSGKRLSAPHLRVAIFAAIVLTISSFNTGILQLKASLSRISSLKSRIVASKMMMTSVKSDDVIARRNILALDFDGVVCASSVESSFSSIVAAENFWHEACKIIKTKDAKSSYTPIDAEEEHSTFRLIRKAVNELRPIVETGFENMLLVRAISEELTLTGSIDTPALMKKWSPAYRDQLILDYGTNKNELVDFFGKTRDDLISEDLQAWVGLNKIYPSVYDCLSNIGPKRLDYTIITTKQERFVTAILEANSITPPDKENIFDLENPFGAKSKVLAALLDKYNQLDKIEDSVKHNKGVKIHFVEDRFETLLAVMKIPALNDIQLYLVDWGYNTEAQREEARKLSPKIKLIDGEEFKILATQFIH